MYITVPPILFTNSQNIRIIALTPFNTQRIKYINLRYKKIIKLINRKIIDLC